MQIRPDSLFARHAQRSTEQARSTSNNASGVDSPNDFMRMLQEGIGRVNSMQNSATTQVEQLMTGEDVQSAEVMTSLQKADMAFRLLVQIRNKLMDAYQEITNIRV